MRARKFNKFVNEAYGYSNSVKAYSEVCKGVINHYFNRYLNFNFKKGTFTNFSVPIVIDDAYAEVSQAVSRDFPIDEIKIDFKIVVGNSWDSMNHTGHYRRQYDKVKLTKGKNEKVNIEIMCSLLIARNQMEISVEKANEYISDILSHELTHAYNDYKDPKGIFATFPYLTSKLEKYDFAEHSPHLKYFIYLIYALSKDEVAAVAGERDHFKDIDEFNNFPGTEIARAGMNFDADTYTRRITNELIEYPAIDYILGNFGELFVKLYKDVAKELKIKPNLNLLKLKKSASLGEVLQHFEVDFKRKGKELFTKLSSKIEHDKFDKNQPQYIP
jgi:hypothetical protein